jgi:hypothetical protein
MARYRKLEAVGGDLRMDAEDNYPTLPTPVHSRSAPRSTTVKAARADATSVRHEPRVCLRSSTPAADANSSKSAPPPASVVESASKTPPTTASTAPTPTTTPPTTTAPPTTTSDALLKQLRFFEWTATVWTAVYFFGMAATVAAMIFVEDHAEAVCTAWYVLSGPVVVKILFAVRPAVFAARAAAAGLAAEGRSVLFTPGDIRASGGAFSSGWEISATVFFNSLLVGGFLRPTPTVAGMCRRARTPRRYRRVGLVQRRAGRVRRQGRRSGRVHRLAQRQRI